MKIPETPPALAEIVDRLVREQRIDRLATLFGENIGPAPGGRYRHWSTLRHIQPPAGLTSEEWWAAIKFARHQLRREIPLRDQNQAAFFYSTPDPALALLHEIDKNASGAVALPEQVMTSHSRDRYIQSSLIEEAITSSQLEGAATTREQAKDMIRRGRAPLDSSERMILNNYRAMQSIRQYKDEPLSPELIFELHQVITRDTFPPNVRAPYLRTPNDGVAVYDDRDNSLIHRPPDAGEIPDRMTTLCDFANQQESAAFLHPVVRSIILHFWLAFDHPFVDGNGRTARALFYWSMLSHDYWLAEFLSISRIIRRAPSRYVRSFLYTETDENDLTYFILSQLRVIQRSIEDLHVYLARKTEETRETERLLRASVSLNHRQLALLSHAQRHPGTRYTIEAHQSSHRVAYQTARTDLLDLASKGLLVRSRAGKAYVFVPVPDLHDRLQQLA